MAAFLCKNLRFTTLLQGTFCVELARFACLFFAFSGSKKTASCPLLLASLLLACFVLGPASGMLGMLGVLVAQPARGKHWARPSPVGTSYTLIASAQALFVASCPAIFSGAAFVGPMCWLGISRVHARWRLEGLCRYWLSLTCNETKANHT